MALPQAKQDVTDARLSRLSMPEGSVWASRAREDALARLRKDYEIHIYPGAEHAFANPTGDAYNAEAAEDAWQKTLTFLNRTLASSDDAS